MKGSVCRFALCVAALATCPLFAQSGAGTAWVRHAPTVNATIEGSLQLMTGESTTLNGGAAVTGDLFVPGTPALRINGSSSTFGGTLAGAGASTPGGYTITLNGNSRLGHLRTRTDPIAFPSVAAAPAPVGMRSVALNNTTQSPGDFATLKNLTLNSNVGPIAVPAGGYGDFTANSGSSFTLGVAGATTAAVYAFQHLTLNSNSRLNVVGPVLLTVANSIAINASLAGAAAHPEWLALRFSGGGLTLNSNVAFHGYVLAPGGTVVVNGNSQLTGGLIADRLTVNGNGTLRLINLAPTAVLSAPAAGAVFFSPAAIGLAAQAADADGVVVKVEFYVDGAKLGEADRAPYQRQWTNVPAGSYTLTAKATDNSGAATTSNSLAVVVDAPPTVALTAPQNNAVVAAASNLALEAAAADADGTVVKVDFYQGSTLLGTDTAPPFQFIWPNVAPGAFTLKAVATDNLGAATISAPLSIVVDLPPAVTLTAPSSGAAVLQFSPISVTASATDSDGTISRVDFYQGTTLLGTATAAVSGQPATFTLKLDGGLAAGSYALRAVATDNLGLATTSASISLEVKRPLPLVVAFSPPPSGTVFAAPASIPLSVAATDPNGGTITKVEFYVGTTLLGTAVAPASGSSSVFSFTPTTAFGAGSYLFTARAYDSFGLVTTSAPIAITVLATLPYGSDFEAAQGYVVGSLSGQLGWTVNQGAALVTNQDTAHGLQSVMLQPGTPPAQIEQEFAPYDGASIIFADFFAKPVAGADLGTAASFDVESSLFAFALNSATGGLKVLDGNGAGGGSWRATGFSMPVGANYQAASWVRLTARLDFTRKQWDLYVNGVMAAADLGFRDNARAYLSSFFVQGDAAAPVLVDDFLAGPQNPLFADVNHDGIDDTWETAHGLSLSADNRRLSPSGSGVTVLQAYLAGTDPNDFYNGQVPQLAIVSGDNQTAAVGQFNALPLVIAVRDHAGTAALANAPVTFAVTSGGGLLATASVGSPTLAASLPLRTDGNGLVQVYYQQPATGGVTSTITMTAGAGQITAHAVSSGVAGDADGNGLPDRWEMEHFGHTGVDPNADPDGDGLASLQEYQNGTDPTDFFNGIVPHVEAANGGSPDSSDALVMMIRKPDGTPWVNAPATFQITAGDRRISATPGGRDYSNTVQVRADSNGVAKAYLEPL